MNEHTIPSDRVAAIQRELSACSTAVAEIQRLDCELRRLADAHRQAAQQYRHQTNSLERQRDCLASRISKMAVLRAELSKLLEGAQ